MALKALKNIITGSFELSQVQANLDQLWKQLNLNPFQTGQWLKGQKLVSGQTSVQHGLGRIPQGWVVTNINGAATIYQVPATLSQANPTNTVLYLHSSAAVTVDLWIF